jgi:hypothetical protein
LQGHVASDVKLPTAELGQKKQVEDTEVGRPAQVSQQPGDQPESSCHFHNVLDEVTEFIPITHASANRWQHAGTA